MKVQADTEMLEAVCENHGKTRERIATTKAEQAVTVPAATLSRYVGVYDVVGNSKYVVTVTRRARRCGSTTTAEARRSCWR